MRYLLQLHGAPREVVPGAFDPHAAFTRELQEAGVFVAGTRDAYVIEADSHAEALEWAKRRCRFRPDPFVLESTSISKEEAREVRTTHLLRRSA